MKQFGKYLLKNRKMRDEDWWFGIFVVSICLTILLDCLLTLEGLSLGLEEGNKLVVLLMNMIGVKETLISITIGSILGVIIGLTYLRAKLKKENQIRALYVLIGMSLAYRTFVIGMWVGMIRLKLFMLN